MNYKREMWNDHPVEGERCQKISKLSFASVKLFQTEVWLFFVSRSLPVSKLFYNLATFLQKPEPL